MLVQHEIMLRYPLGRAFSPNSYRPSQVYEKKLSIWWEDVGGCLMLRTAYATDLVQADQMLQNGCKEMLWEVVPLQYILVLVVNRFS